jgi:hypothetical protein
MRKLFALVALALVACDGSTAIFVDVPTPPDVEGGSARAMQMARADDAGAPDPAALSPSAVDPPDAGGDAPTAPDPAAPDAGPSAVPEASTASATDAGGASDAHADAPTCYDLTKPPSNCTKLAPQGWCTSMYVPATAFFCPAGNAGSAPDPGGFCDPASNIGQYCCSTGPGFACP